jgi:peptide deformylase
MAILDILHFPDPRLRKQATVVKQVDAKIRTLVRDMFETMYYAHGIGLAATQVNIHQRVIVIDISGYAENSNETRNANQPPLCLINPKILHAEGEIIWEEGCLSVPNTYDKVKRYNKVKVEALNEKGESYVLEAEELLAVCIQHEIDHLEGKLFVDHLSSLKRQRIRQKLEKQQREKA